MQVSDDGTVLFVQERFEVGVRPQTDAELNRLYPTYSKDGMESINPYTYGDWQDPETGSTPQRFTVFLLKVKNYSYPKVQIDPLKVSLIAANGREYPALDPLEFDEYYRPYATAYSGNLYDRYEERKDLFASSRYAPEPVFSGQEAQGFLVFPASTSRRAGTAPQARGCGDPIRFSGRSNRSARPRISFFSGNRPDLSRWDDENVFGVIGL